MAWSLASQPDALFTLGSDLFGGTLLICFIVYTYQCVWYYKLIQHRCHYDLRKLSFTNRVIPIWNSLPNYVVSADTTNTFENRLDKFWSDQDVL